MPSNQRSVALAFGILATVTTVIHTIKKLQGTARERTSSDDTNPVHPDKKTNTQDEGSSHHRRSSSPSQSEWSELLPSHIIREHTKEKRRQEKMPLLAMKTKMYDNITMLDPQGQTLSKISRKKARWYVNKGLATWKDDGDAFIQLKFEPKARSEDGDYGRSTKQNICVSCGDGCKSQMRFSIVPHAYRSLFPKRYKTHMSHDVVLLCADCHLRVGQASNLRMNELEDKFVPQKRYSTDFEQYKVRSAALALINWRHQIPEEKVALHETIVRTYFSKSGGQVSGKEELSIDLLQSVIDVEYRIENPKYVPGPELVVKSIVDNDDEMTAFIRQWRIFFIDTIHPRHLPDGWSVNHPVACDDT